eukprot:TRINITY_DN1921_c0_g1_i1.p1 TRINITY_DN1921_c0_g1~~TRINITY_DN1921_c0_g1_i1.p1  ORF type:complete len:242 (-),score=50.99 TRINITY_DN1921_c0_g1_i1:331-1056(-)
MGRDDSRERKSKKKKSKKSRSRSRSRSRERKRARSRSRDRRSRSRGRRSRSRSRRRSRSRDKRERRSISRSRRSRSRDRKSRRSRSNSRSRSRRRSTSRSRRRSRSDSRSRSSNPKSSYKSREASITPEKKSDVNLIVDEVKRQKQIADIEADTFVQQNFRSANTRVAGGVAQDDDIVEVGMEFGTSGELAANRDAKSKAEKLNSEGLINPDFFGDQEERESRYLTELFTIRQKHLNKRSI